MEFLIKTDLIEQKEKFSLFKIFTFQERKKGWGEDDCAFKYYFSWLKQRFRIKTRSIISNEFNTALFDTFNKPAGRTYTNMDILYYEYDRLNSVWILFQWLWLWPKYLRTHHDEPFPLFNSISNIKGRNLQERKHSKKTNSEPMTHFPLIDHCFNIKFRLVIIESRASPGYVSFLDKGSTFDTI